MYPYKILIICLAIQYIAVAYRGYKKTRQIFSPETIISIMYLIKSVPHLWIICNSLNNLNYRIYNHSSWPGIHTSLIRYIIFSSISHFSLLIGLLTYRKIKHKDKGLVFRINDDPKKLEKVGWIILLLGVMLFYLVIRNVGGIVYLLTNIAKRAHLLRGEGYIFMMMQACITLSVCIFTYNLKNNNSFLYKIKFLIVVVSSFIIMTSFGGRTPSINLIINILLILSFTNSNFKIISIKNGFLFILLWVYILVMPMLRVEDPINTYLKNPKVLINEVSDDIFNIIEEISIVDENMFVFNYFNRSNYWLGSSYLDLLKAPIPSKIYKDKPPVDDGMYIWNILIGNDVRPSASVNSMHHSSWPLNTTGMMYANFGIVGVIIGMMVMGYIYSYMYYLVIRSNRNLFVLTVYFYTLFRFEISNLYIVQTITPIIINIILFKILLNLKIRTIRKL